MDNQVDTKRLGKAIFVGQCFARRPKLAIAPNEVADELAGYGSGTMEPIFHTMDMKLFVEKSLIEGVDDLSAHRINVGSGMFGKCLSLSAKIFLRVANESSEVVKLCSIVQ